MAEDLTKDQLAFLEECNLEFSERYTDADLEYKRVYDSGIPPPPIVYPWWGRSIEKGGSMGRRHFNRDRPGSSRYNDCYRERNSDHGQEDLRRYGTLSVNDNLYGDEGERRRYNDTYRDRSRDSRRGDSYSYRDRSREFRREDNHSQQYSTHPHYRPY